MKHYISICGGKESKTARRVDLFEWSVLATLPENAQENKEDSLLVFNGYNAFADEYPRKEDALTDASSIFIDCDNPNHDPHILEKWRNLMQGYDYMTYETASSTPERPKFRAIVPLETDIPWNKWTKRAITYIFREFADPKASWYFSPTRDKLDTIEDHVAGKWYPVAGILEQANRIQRDAKIAESIRALVSINKPRAPQGEFQRQEGGWRHLPSVKKCLSGLCVGERDNALNAACYAMDKNGYRGNIGEFLNEVAVDNAIKQKFRIKYR